MIRNFKILLAAVVFLCTCHLSLSTDVYASFEETGIGARPAALGGAFTSVADDVHALYYNPAGLSRINRKELSTSYGLLNTGLSDNSNINHSYAAYAHPFQSKIGTFGFSWEQFYVQNLYKEQTISFGYGRKFFRSLALGIAFKRLYREFSAPTGQTDETGFVDTGKTDPLYADSNSRSNYAVDAGILYKFCKKYSLGIMVQDINQPDIAISKQNREIQPIVIRSGIAYQERTMILAGQLNTVKSPAGLTNNLFFTLAAEKWWLAARWLHADLAVRASFSAGPESFSQTAMGLSYQFWAIRIDYGFLMPLKGITFGSTQGSHRISLTFRFGQRTQDIGVELALH